MRRVWVGIVTVFLLAHQAAAMSPLKSSLRMEDFLGNYTNQDICSPPCPQHNLLLSALVLGSLDPDSRKSDGLQAGITSLHVQVGAPRTILISGFAGDRFVAQRAFALGREVKIEGDTVEILGIGNGPVVLHIDTQGSLIFFDKAGGIKFARQLSD